MDKRTAAYKNKLSEVKMYMRDRKFPKELAKEVKEYYKYYLSRQSLFDEETILMEISRNLRQLIKSSDCLCPHTTHARTHAHARTHTHAHAHSHSLTRMPKPTLTHFVLMHRARGRHSG